MRTPLLAVVLLACQTQGTAEVRPVEVVLRDARGAVELVLTRTPAGCLTDESLAITVAGPQVSAGAWMLAPGPAGRELRGPAGTIARITDAERAGSRTLSLIDPIGVPLARMTFTAGAVELTDAGRSPVGTIERRGDDHVLTPPASADPAAPAPTGRATAGTTDLELAARLLVPAPLPVEARALFACERLVAVTPAVK